MDGKTRVPRNDRTLRFIPLLFSLVLCLILSALLLQFSPNVSLNATQQSDTEIGYQVPSGPGEMDTPFGSEDDAFFAICCGSIIAIFIMGIWVYKDAEEHGENGAIWFLIILLANFVVPIAGSFGVLIIYWFTVRNKKPQAYWNYPYYGGYPGQPPLPHYVPPPSEFYPDQGPYQDQYYSGDPYNQPSSYRDPYNQPSSYGDPHNQQSSYGDPYQSYNVGNPYPPSAYGYTPPPHEPGYGHAPSYDEPGYHDTTPLIESDYQNPYFPYDRPSTDDPYWNESQGQSFRKRTMRERVREWREDLMDDGEYREGHQK